jgi:hypothetical protein
VKNRETELLENGPAPKKLAPDGTLIVEAVDPATPLDETDVIMEFLLVSLCKNLGVKLK